MQDWLKLTFGTREAYYRGKIGQHVPLVPPWCEGWRCRQSLQIPAGSHRVLAPTWQTHYQKDNTKQMLVFLYV